MPKIQKITSYLLLIIIALVPFIWSTQINGNYYNAKLFLVYLLSGLSLTSICLKQPLNLTKLTLPIWLTLPLCYFTIYLVIYPIISLHFTNYLYTFKILAFSSLSYYFLSEENLTSLLTTKKFIQIFIFFALIFLLGIHITEIYKFRFINETLDHARLLGTFGNVNMMAEFFILSLPLVFFWTRKNTLIPNLLKYAALCLWIFIVLYTRSRSAWMGLALFFIYIFFKKITLSEALSFIMALFIFIALSLLPTKNNSTVDINVKMNSFAERIALYKSSLSIMNDNPFGLGLGVFVNELIPYRLQQEFKPFEFEYADQPHSEILKWGVQFGWLGFTLSLFLLCFIFIDLIRLNDKFLMSGFLVIIPQLFFQFPFENPAGILLLAIYTGRWLQFKKTNLLLDENTKENLKKNIFFKLFYPKTTLAIFILLSLAALLNSVLFISATYVESQYSNDLEKTSLMCKLYPINQRNCNYKNVMILEKNQTALFRSDFKSEIQLYYLTSDVQRILPLYFQKMNDEKHLCENILIYKMMYPVQNHFNKQDIQFCSKYPVPFKIENPLQFKSDYLNWLTKAVF